MASRLHSDCPNTFHPELSAKIHQPQQKNGRKWKCIAQIWLIPINLNQEHTGRDGRRSGMGVGDLEDRGHWLQRQERLGDPRFTG